MTSPNRIAELKERIKLTRRGETHLGSNPNHSKCSPYRICNTCFIYANELEAELLGRQEQEKEDNKKFADFLDKAKSLAKVYDKDGELYSLIKEKIRELTEGEDK